MKKKYRVRDGSFIDYARYGLVGLIFGLGMAFVTNSAYPI
jgi:hypothetical protein